MCVHSCVCACQCVGECVCMFKSECVRDSVFLMFFVKK